MKNQTNDSELLGNWSGVGKGCTTWKQEGDSEDSELRVPKKCFDKTLKWKILFWVNPTFTFFQLVLFKMYASYIFVFNVHVS